MGNQRGGLDMRGAIAGFAIILIQPILMFCPISGSVIGLSYDYDESGLAPTTMDCDSSIEDSVCIDFREICK